LLLTECQELFRQGRGPLRGMLDILEITVQPRIGAHALP
jgi:hypothetical protein